jgi:hypothetical protein
MKSITSYIQLLKNKRINDLKIYLSSAEIDFLINGYQFKPVVYTFFEPDYIVHESIVKKYKKVFDKLDIDISTRKHPPEGENNILTDETNQLIQKNYETIQQGKHPPEAENNILTKDVIDFIEENQEAIKQYLLNKNNILDKDTIDLIQKNYEIIQRGKQPPEAENNILTDQTLSKINENDEIIKRGKHPPEAENNIIVDSTLDLIQKNYEIIQHGKQPLEGENNILTDETNNLIQKNYETIQHGKQPLEGENNILTDETNNLIQKNYETIHHGKQPLEGENNILTDETNNLIQKNYETIQQGKHPPEAENNIIVDSTLDLIQKNYETIQQGKHPPEAENNILTDEANQLIQKNYEIIQHGKQPQEGENNILTYETNQLIQKNYETIQQGKHPPEAENNILTGQTLSRINENDEIIKRGKHPPEGENNILTDETNDLIRKNYEIIQLGKHPPEAENNILTGQTLSRINENDEIIKRGKQPPEAENNILTDETNKLIQKNYETIQLGKQPPEAENNILTDETNKLIQKNYETIQLGKQPPEAENNILIGQTLSRINKNDEIIKRGKQPFEAENNILISGVYKSGFETIDTIKTINLHEDVNFWSGKNKYDEINDTNYNIKGEVIYRFDASRFKDITSYIRTGNTYIGNFNNSNYEFNYLSEHHGRYGYRKWSAEQKSKSLVQVYDNDEETLKLSRPLSLSNLIDREQIVIFNMSKIGYRFEYNTSQPRIGNIETQYNISYNLQDGEPTGFKGDDNSKFRNYFFESGSFRNKYAYAKHENSPLVIARGGEYDYSSYNTISMLYPHRDSEGRFYIPPKKHDLVRLVRLSSKNTYQPPATGRVGTVGFKGGTFMRMDNYSNEQALDNEGLIYEDTPLSDSDLDLYAKDPTSVFNGKNSVRDILKAKASAQLLYDTLNKFGPNQYDLEEYSLEYYDVPGGAWLSEDLQIEDFRYYKVNKDAEPLNPGNYNFGNVKKYEGTWGLRRQIDYYRNNPEISFALSEMSKLFLANPRNAQIFDPISMFWHPEFAKSAAIDVRKDLRLLGSGPKTYAGYFRAEGMISGLANAMGGDGGEFLNKLAPFIETGFDILTKGETVYSNRVHANGGIVWAELGNSGQLSLDSNNLLARGGDVISQFINPASFTLFNEVDRYISGFQDGLFTNGNNMVLLAAKLGQNLGQIAGSEFRIMKGRDQLTPAQTLLGEGPVTLNGALELVGQVFGDRVDNLDFIDSGQSFHEYMTDPRVWNLDQRLLWHNMGARLMSIPDRGTEDDTGMLDPMTLLKSGLQIVAGINLDDPMGSTFDDINNLYKKIAQEDEKNFESHLQLRKKKTEALLSSTSDKNGELYKNDETKQRMQEHTAYGTRPDWLLEKHEHERYDDIATKRYATLHRFGYESNFKHENFDKFYLDYNDGNVQYQAKNDRSDTAGKLVEFDYFDYIGTVKVATPNIDAISKAELKQREDINRETSRVQNKVESCQITMSLSSVPSEHIDPESLKAYIQSKFGSISTEVSILSSSNQQFSFNCNFINQEGEDKQAVETVCNAIKTEATSSTVGSFPTQYHSAGYSINNKQPNTQSYNEDIVEDENDIIAKQGIAPVTFEKINTLLNVINPQIFRFWMRTINRTHYEVTPEMYYLDDNNKVALTKPRYTGHSVVFFDAIIKSMNDNFVPRWNSTNFFGRTEEVHTWQATARNLDFQTSFVCSSPSQLPSLRAKIQELIRMLYPQIQTIKAVGTLAYRAGPVIEFAIGDQMRNYGIINNMTINWGVGGEPMFEIFEGGQFVRGAELNFNISVIHKELPHAGTEFFAESFDPSLFYHEEAIKQKIGKKTIASYIMLSEEETNTKRPKDQLRAISNDYIRGINPFDTGGIV